MYDDDTPPCFEDDVATLVRVASRVAKALGPTHPLYGSLIDATANVEQWSESQDPRDMGWVGDDGLP